MSDSTEPTKHVTLAAELVAAFVANNSLPVSELPALLASVHGAFMAIARGAPAAPAPPVAREPAVPIRKSVTPEHIVCLEDGKTFKSLKRHLTAHGLTPEAYRQKWGLPRDYPMVAPNYAKARSALALSSGLGRKRAVEEKPKGKRGRPAKPKAPQEDATEEA